MKKLLIVLIILAAFCSGVNAATHTVGLTSGACGGTCDHYGSTAIQDCENWADSGGPNTCLVYSGTYQESVTVDGPDITFQSVNEYGAVMDGDGGSLAKAFNVTTAGDGITITGFKFQNYKLDVIATGIVHLFFATDATVKYNWFTNNERAIGNSGFIYGNGAAYNVVRGNLFSGNTQVYADGGDICYTSCGRVTVELNDFQDNDAEQYNIYHAGQCNMRATYRYNRFKNSNRFRKCGDYAEYQIYHNIFERELNLHDDTAMACAGDASENAYEAHDLYRNTFYMRDSCNWGAMNPAGINGTTYTDNVFGDGGSYISYGAESASYRNSDNTWVDNVIESSTMLSLLGPNMTASPNDVESGTVEDGDLNYNTSTGWHDQLVNNKGADLKISVWPFTTHSDTPLQTDYPYGGPDSTPPTFSSASIATNGTDVTINFSEIVVTTGYDTGDFNLDCSVTGANINLSSPSGTGSSRTFTAASTIQYNDVCNLDYIGSTNDIEDSSGNDMVAVDDLSITNNSIQGGTDTDDPVLSNYSFSPDPEICYTPPNQEFTISITATDPSESNVICGIMFTSNVGTFTSAFNPSSPPNFGVTAGSQYVAMTCGSEITECSSGSTLSYYPNLDCDDSTNYYTVFCWDVYGNLSSQSSSLSVTPPSTQESTTSGRSPADLETDVLRNTTIQITVSNESGGITAGSIGMSLNGTAYDCDDAELSCSGDTNSYDVTLTPPVILASRTRYTVAFSAYGLSTDEVWDFTTAQTESFGQRFTLLNGYIYN